MFSLATLSRMNTQREVFKLRRIARAMNCPSGHPKDAEKGRGCAHFLGKKLGGVDKRKLARISSVAL